MTIGSKNRIGKTAWIILAIVTIVCIQSYWLFKRYEILESGKVLKWVFYIILPSLTIIGLIFNSYLTKIIFYTRWTNYSKNKISKSRQNLNAFTSLFLFLFLSTIFSYNLIIQSNEWLGSSNTYKFNCLILDTIKTDSKRRDSFQVYEFKVRYLENDIWLKSNKIKTIGHVFNETLNTGGKWGVIYKTKSL